MLITFRLRLNGEVIKEETAPALGYGTVEKIGKAFEASGSLVGARFDVEFEFDPPLLVQREAAIEG